MLTIEYGKRRDGRRGFRLVAENGQTVGTDGAQGYENKGDLLKTIETSILRPIREGRVAIIEVDELAE